MLLYSGTSCLTSAQPSSVTPHVTLGNAAHRGRSSFPRTSFAFRSEHALPVHFVTGHDERAVTNDELDRYQ